MPNSAIAGSLIVRFLLGCLFPFPFRFGRSAFALFSREKKGETAKQTDRRVSPTFRGGQAKRVYLSAA
jgi:hypothetical protein